MFLADFGVLGMSNRNGKHNKNKFKVGHLCRRCGKGKLESAYHRSYPGKLWGKYVFCRTCNFTNY